MMQYLHERVEVVMEQSGVVLQPAVLHQGHSLLLRLLLPPVTDVPQALA